MSRIKVNSEIGKLKKVIIHEPGLEIERMTPTTAENLLYDDILDLKDSLIEHDQLVNILKKHANVLEIKDLLADILEGKDERKKLLSDLNKIMKASPELIEELLDYSSKDLAEALFHGIKEKKDTLVKFMNDKVYAFPPLPNFFYTRDSAMVLNNCVITGSMASKIRASESIIMEHIFQNHPELKPNDFYHDGVAHNETDLTVEGGDILILREDVLAIGLSERTNPQALDYLIQKFKAKGIIKHIFAFVLPKERATIHLDMVFTMVDKHYAVVSAPFIFNSNKVKYIYINIENKRTRFEYVDNILKSMREKVNIDLKPVYCGGQNPIRQEREQWMAGANYFTMAPGKIIGYSRNTETFNELDKVANIPTLLASDILSGKVDLKDYDRYAIGILGAELSRGGGGARCMTMPVLRDEVEW